MLWGTVVAMTQLLSLRWLLALAAGLLPAAAFLARRRLFLLLWRTRWLLASILLLFALVTPGVLLIPALGGFGPTGEGLILGLTHSLRLLLVLAPLAILLELSALDDLVAGLYGLLWPLGGLGLNRARVALRIMLVLRYVEEAPRGAHWREWLEHAEAPGEAAPIRVRAAPLAAADYAVHAALAAATLAAWRWA
ncbi:MAG: hypothetical protein HYZ19_04555 [Rhodocyclales bacterium]|nr:hypothetical protein [Rhodocyclales bacterium]